MGQTGIISVSSFGPIGSWCWVGAKTSWELVLLWSLLTGLLFHTHTATKKPRHDIIMSHPMLSLLHWAAVVDQGSGRLPVDVSLLSCLSLKVLLLLVNAHSCADQNPHVDQTLLQTGFTSAGLSGVHKCQQVILKHKKEWWSKHSC